MDAVRVAVLIDCDNISWQLGAAVLAEAAEKGTLGVSRRPQAGGQHRWVGAPVRAPYRAPLTRLAAGAAEGATHGEKRTLIDERPSWP